MKDQKATSSIRRNYDDEFKRNALKMVENGQSVRSVAAALGISESLLHAWRRSARRELSSSDREIAQLRARLRQVELERDILKKALSISSRQT